MTPFLRSRAAIAGAGAVAVAMGAIGFVPLFGGPGYESSLAAGLVVPIAAAIVTALEVARQPAGEAARPEPFEAFSRGLANGGALAAIAYVTVLVHGIRTGFCDVLGGSAHFALGPAAGALLAGAWGALAGELVAIARPAPPAASRARRAARAIGVALLGAALPLASIAVSVWRFYASPMVFAYDPFVGFFSGSLYDTVVDFGGLITYRAGSAASLLALFVAAVHLGRRDAEGARNRLVFSAQHEGGGPRLRGRPGLLVLGAAALAASGAQIAVGYRLGHWHTPSTIAERLGARLSGDRCDVIYPRTMRIADVQRFARDCDAHLAAGERWFGARGPDRVTAYLFADAAQKAAMMGAADTYIAKPWRREVYVQAAGYPHPVLGHELMHVLAGAFARGPFKVAGSAWGLLPDPGLIEGVAVAAAPREGDLTPREWARAMKDLGILPPLARLFTLGFFGENSSTAYTVSGAFVGWIHDRFGAGAVRAWYGGGSLPAITGTPWAELERAWHADLDGVALPEAARAQAKARFDRPAIFGRRCPHVVDACKERAESLRGAGDHEGAIAEYRRAIALDAGDFGSRIAIAKARINRGDVEEGTRELEQIAAEPKAPRHVRDRALEELGDLALAAGQGEAAIKRYAELSQRTVDEDRLRTLEVKVAAAKDPRARPAIVALLIGGKGRGPDRQLAAELLGAWAASEEGARDGLPWYLLGRQLFGSGQYDEAAERLDKALAAPIAIERVRVEAERVRMVTACARGDARDAARFYAAYAAHAGVTEARRDAARSLVERCAGALPEEPARGGAKGGDGDGREAPGGK